MYRKDELPRSVPDGVKTTSKGNSRQRRRGGPPSPGPSPLKLEPRPLGPVIYVICFWDEPETNLNPKLYGAVIDIILELQRLGVQSFLATHDYLILKEFDLRQKSDDAIAFHSLYRDEGTSEIACHTSHQFVDIHPNAIAEAF